MKNEQNETLLFLVIILFHACEDEPPISVASIMDVGNISATVTDQDDNPVEGALVKIEPGNLSYVTDSTGVITTSMLGAGNYSIMLNKENYADTSHSVEVLPAQKNEVDLQILEKGSIAGYIMDPAHPGPAENARFTTVPETGDYFSNSDGEFLIPWLDEGTYIVKVHNLPQIAVTEHSIQVKNGETSILLFGQVGKGKITGYVTDQYNHPVENAEVIISPGNKNAVTNYSGYFSSGYLEAGEYTLEISGEHYESASYQTKVYDGGLISETYIVEIFGGISGKVTDQDGIPLKGASITIDPCNINLVTDWEGRFMYEYLEAGTYDIIVAKENYASMEYEVQIENGFTTNGNCQLNILGGIEGRIVDYNTGIPVLNVKITTEPQTDSVFTDEYGKYRIDYLDEGSYIVMAWHSDYLENRETVEIINSENAKVDFVIHKKVELVFVEGGSFEMGDIRDIGNPDEKPVHTVILDDFFIGKYEVTNEEFMFFLNENGNQEVDGVPWINLSQNSNRIYESEGKFHIKSGHGKFPVGSVTWYGAKAFCEWVGGRLPTEAEWEYAARGGQQSQGYLYSGSDHISFVSWWEQNSGYTNHIVGLKLANELGIYDMTGNVAEYCNDRWDSNYYSISPVYNPQGPSTGSAVVERGGSYASNTHYGRIAHRLFAQKNAPTFRRGFRVVHD